MELKGRNYIYGIAGLAGLLGCSNLTAQKIKNSGNIPFVQVGRKIIFDEDKVMEALSQNRKGVLNG
jgi:excisionase family DNA binding protein